MKQVIVMLLLSVSGVAGYAQNPGAEQDALAERQRILRAADQLELLSQQTSQLAQHLTTLTERVLKLESANNDLKTQMARQQKEWAAERERWSGEVARLSASGGKVEKPAAGDTATPVKQEAGFWYDVQAGQSLWAIADAYQKSGVNVSVNDIRKANNLKDDVLKIGQRLFIPKK